MAPADPDLRRWWAVCAPCGPDTFDHGAGHEICHEPRDSIRATVGWHAAGFGDEDMAVAGYPAHAVPVARDCRRG